MQDSFDVSDASKQQLASEYHACGMPAQRQVVSKILASLSEDDRTFATEQCHNAISGMRGQLAASGVLAYAAAYNNKSIYNAALYAPLRKFLSLTLLHLTNTDETSLAQRALDGDSCYICVLDNLPKYLLRESLDATHIAFPILDARQLAKSTIEAMATRLGDRVYRMTLDRIRAGFSHVFTPNNWRGACIIGARWVVCELHQYQAHKLCVLCGCRASKVCGRCRSARYCGAACQAAHFEIHKSECGLFT